MTHPSLPEGRRGQLAAAGLLLLVIALAYVAVVSPLLGLYHDRSGHLADRQAYLDHALATVDGLPALRNAAAEAVRSPTGAGGTFLAGDNDAMAGASLQGLLQDMAAAAGTTLVSEEVLPAEQQGRFRRISLRITLTADWPVLMALLQSVETSPYQLLIDDLQLHAASRMGPVTASTGPVETSFVVIGFRTAETDLPGKTRSRNDALRADARPPGAVIERP